MKIIEHLKKLRAKATHGRWRGHDAGPKHDFGFGISSPEAEKDIVDWVRGGKADQDLIVAAINALPALLEVAEAVDKLGTDPTCYGLELDELIKSREKLRKIQP